MGAAMSRLDTSAVVFLMAVGLQLFLLVPVSAAPCYVDRSCVEIAQINIPNPFNPSNPVNLPNPLNQANPQNLLNPLAPLTQVDTTVRAAATSLGIPVPGPSIRSLNPPNPSEPWNPLGLPNFPDPAKVSVMITKESLKVTVDTINKLGKAVQDIDNARKKSENDINRNVGKGLDDTVAEMGRAVRNIGDAIRAIAKYSELETKGTFQTFNNAERRVREGKVIDALWHMGTEPMQHTEKNAGNAALESSLIATVGSVAASFYGGPAGAAAYAAWLTYRQTGDANLALKVGIIAYASSLAMGDVKKIPVDSASDVTKKAAVTAAIGGIAVAASGGDEAAIKNGFLRAGVMVLIQDGYKSYTNGDIEENAGASQGNPFCLSDKQINCDKPPAGSYDNKGINMRKLDKADQNRPHVGIQVLNGEEPQWNQETSIFMKAISKIPGTNAGAIFHDQLCYDMAFDTSMTKLTILPTLVLTYYGTSAPYLESVRSAAVKQSNTQNKGQKTQSSQDTLLVTDETAKEPIVPKNLETTFLCVKDADARTIALEIPISQQSFACRIVYSSGGKRSVKWRSTNDANYCTPHVSEIPKALLASGFKCLRGDATDQTIRFTPNNLVASDGVRVPRPGDVTIRYGNVLLDSYEGNSPVPPKTNRRFVDWKVPYIRPGKFKVDIAYASPDARPLRLVINGKVVVPKVADKVTGGLADSDFQVAEFGQFEIGSKSAVIRLETASEATSWPRVKEMRFVRLAR